MEWQIELINIVEIPTSDYLQVVFDAFQDLVDVYDGGF